MDCPHLLENINILEDFIPVKVEATKDWQCAVCSTSQSPWICLQCGVINCGRYVSGHAKVHSDENSGHSICMGCDTLSFYCYKCDEFISNDTQCGMLGKVRDRLSPNPMSCDMDGREDDDTSWRSDPVTKELQENARCLRPRSRKRSHCVDSEGIENEPTPKHQVDDHAGNVPKPKGKKAVGLRNLGNTCFMNAVLQSLSNIEAFCFYLKQLPSLDDGDAHVSTRARALKEVKQQAVMAEELRKVIVSLSQGEAKSAIAPDSLFTVIWKVVPRFRGYQQQDAHEFLRYMLDRLHTELHHLLPDATQKDSSYVALGQTLKGRTSIVTSIFGGTLQSEVRCLNCGGESKKQDPFLDLSLDIPDQFLGQTDKNGADCDLTDCLRSFVQVEELGDTEQYLCNTCQSKQRSTKRFWIRRLPNVLCLHLKRFRWYSGYRTKVDVNVSFPVHALDMTQFTLGSSSHDGRLNGTIDNLYDLAAIIVHHGTGAGSGHYTAFATNESGWYHFNDSTVRPALPLQVSSCKAYILFYIRRAFKLPDVKTVS